MILVSELGDKTFFIAAVMAMKHPRSAVLTGALGALALMTVLSAAAGFALPNLIPREYTHSASVVLFLIFGLKLLRDGYGMESEGPSEELEEVEQSLKLGDSKKDPDVEGGSAGPRAGVASLGAALLRGAMGAVAWQAFTLTFLAEWGDRSQIATIALAANKDPFAVSLGGVLGHAACTTMAVVGGKLLAARISERTVALCGGSLFLLFAAHGAWQGASSLHND
jgi:putative Ca2+/H+ antiporter (TMEM165/GDT1 family)